MRSFHHWSIRYIYDKINEIIYRRRFPDHPWLTEAANSIINSFLRKSDIGLEFGSGRSTIWFAQRVSFLTSVEHDKLWYNKIIEELIKLRIFNVDYNLCPNDLEESNAKYSRYVQIAYNFPDNSLDFVLVDGIYRAACANAVIDKILPGGQLIIDNANWYLPCNSISPNSRSFADGPAAIEWMNFLQAVKNWRCIWTSNGVSDTAIFLKPGHK